MTEPTLAEKTILEVRLLSDVARFNRSYLSLKDVTTLTSISLTEEELRASWNSIPELGTYKLKEDVLLDQDLEPHEGPDSPLAIMEGNKARAKSYLNFAKTFVSLAGEASSKLISISGSTSYLSAKSDDDLDFFLVSEKGNLWILLFKSLMFARIFRILHPHSPRICFSYAIDEAFAQKIFAKGDPLLARDALNLVVLRGKNYYQNLIGKNKWMSKFFPRLHRLRTESYNPGEIESERSHSSSFTSFLNLFLYFSLGNYIRIKSSLLNRRFLRKSMTQSLFTVRTGSDHCIFDSYRYMKLRQIYDRQGSPIQGKPESPKKLGDAPT